MLEDKTILKIRTPLSLFLRNNQPIASNPFLTKPSISLVLVATYLQHPHDQEVCSPPPEITASC